MALQEGDRVSRIIEIGRPDRRCGYVTKKYKSAQSSYSCTYWLYEVQFDNASEPERGFMEHGLQKEER